MQHLDQLITPTLAIHLTAVFPLAGPSPYLWINSFIRSYRYSLASRDITRPAPGANSRSKRRVVQWDTVR